MSERENHFEVAPALELGLRFLEDLLELLVGIRWHLDSAINIGAFFLLLLDGLAEGTLAVGVGGEHRLLLALSEHASANRAGCPLVLMVYKADQVQEIRKHVAFDFLVERTVTRQTWAEVDFQEPWVQEVINEDVEPKELEAIVPVRHVLVENLSQSRFHTQNSLIDYIINLLKQLFIINIVLLQYRPKALDAPFGAYLIFRFIFVLLESLFVVFVQTIVGKMTKFTFHLVQIFIRTVVFWGFILCRGESG